MGNTNFTFLSDINYFDKKRNSDLICKAINSFGVDAQFSGRNDILVNGVKISGSAFKMSGKRAFHHGTLLINVDMDALSKYLNVNKLKLKVNNSKIIL